MGFDLNESREGYCRRGRGRSFYVEGPKAEKAREPTVESLVRGMSRYINVDLSKTNHGYSREDQRVKKREFGS